MTTTTATSSTSATNPYDYLNASSSSSSSALSTAKEQSDRFLKLLTAQLQNQDPMNPMDNAQMTSQMAQISTVSSLETVNASLTSLGTQFVQMQALQGAALVGRSVLVEGDRLSVDAEGTGTGSYELSANASAVKLEILSSSGSVIDTQNLGAQDAGRQTFEWEGSLSDSDNASFRITATASDGTTLTTTTLMHDQVRSINTSGTTLTLDLAYSGAVDYSDVKGLN